MEHIGKAANKAQQVVKTPQPQDRPQSTPEHHKTMLVMWTAMAHAFGSAWVSQYGTSEESAFRSWSKGLEAYTPDQIKRGIKNSVDPKLWDNAFPPNMSQFGKLCLTVQHAAPYHKPFIEHKPVRASKSIRERELKRQEYLAQTGSLPDETFEESYDKLCRHRWGPLSPERIEQTK